MNISVICVIWKAADQPNICCKIIFKALRCQMLFLQVIRSFRLHLNSPPYQLKTISPIKVSSSAAKSRILLSRIKLGFPFDCVLLVWYTFTNGLVWKCFERNSFLLMERKKTALIFRINLYFFKSLCVVSSCTFKLL